MTDDTIVAFRPGWHFKAAFAAIMVLVLMAALEATSLPIALPTLSNDLHGSTIDTFWCGTSFLLASTIVQPSLGRFSSIFSRKYLLLISAAIFGVGSVVSGIADSMPTVLVGRTVMGVGCGGILTLSQIIITDTVPLRHRGKWFSVQSVMWSLGTVGGPLLGGGFTQSITWRWIFYINLPFIAISTPMIIVFLRLNSPVSSILAKLRRVDWIGTILFTGSVTGFLMSLSWGGIQYAWDSWRTLVPLIVCTAGLVLFVLYEEFRASEPLILSVVFKNRTAASVYLQTFLHGVLLWCMLYYLPLYYEAVKGRSPVETGISVLPVTFTVSPSAVVTGIVVARTGQYRWAILSGWLLVTIGTGLLIKLEAGTGTIAYVFLTLVGGVGFGILFPSMTIAVQAATSNTHQAYAVTVFTFTRAFGQAVGVAIGGVIFQNSLRQKLLGFPELADSAEAYSQDATALVRTIRDMPAGPRRTMFEDSYAQALQTVWLVICALAGIALTSTIFTRGLSLDQELKSEQGLRHDDDRKEPSVELGTRPTA